MSSADEYLARKLSTRAEAGNLRSLPVTTSGADFCSNDYLGIATMGIPGTAGVIGGTGATGSRLISGNDRFTCDTESQIASHHLAQAALIFNSGYDANIGLLSAIAGRDVIFIYDELCHASIIDGIRLGLCRHKYHFAHNNLNHLEDLLRTHAGKAQLFVVLESVYSMDGDFAPLKEAVTLCRQYGAALIVDEAHATGVFGANGEGLVCELGLQEQVYARVHTFGKALGCHGAAVVGSTVLRDYLVNFARSFIYSTALPPHAIHAISSVYTYMASAHFSHRPLHDNIALFRRLVQAAPGIEWLQSNSAIQGAVIPGNNTVKALAARLHDAHLSVHAILHPTVPQSRERLRICLHTFNTGDDIRKLVQLISS